MSFVFDSGYLFGVASTGQPVRFGSLQGISVDERFTLNRTKLPLQAAAQFTIAGLELKFEAKVANLTGTIATQLFLGETPSAGSNAVLRDLLATVPASSPFTVTPAPPGTWAQDLGVQYSSSGLYLMPVASIPAKGQYSVSGGVYTFSSADAGAPLTMNILYSQTSGNSLTLTNNWQGVAPYFSAILNTLYNGTQITWQLRRCVSERLSMLTKVNEISVPNFSFRALGDATGLVQGELGTFSYSD